MAVDSLLCFMYPKTISNKVSLTVNGELLNICCMHAKRKGLADLKMDVRLIQVPYDSGSYNKRMGKGPFCFIKNGLIEILKEKSYSIEEAVIRSKETFTMEIGTSFELLRLVAGEVGDSLSKKAFPIILAGNG